MSASLAGAIRTRCQPTWTRRWPACADVSRPSGAPCTTSRRSARPTTSRTAWRWTARPRAPSSWRTTQTRRPGTDGTRVVLAARRGPLRVGGAAPGRGRRRRRSCTLWPRAWPWRRRSGRPPGLRRSSIKWPNDLVVGGRKLCGILAEGSASHGAFRHVVVGFGDQSAGRRLSRPRSPDRATSIEAELGRPVDRGVVLAATLASLAARCRGPARVAVRCYPARAGERSRPPASASAVEWSGPADAAVATTAGIDDGWRAAGARERRRSSGSSPAKCDGVTRHGLARPVVAGHDIHAPRH